jgi:phage tail protein X
MTEPATLTTTDGDMLDAICQRHYGRASGVVEQVLAANPHVLDQPPQLPSGLVLTLPAIAPESVRQPRLW